VQAEHLRPPSIKQGVLAYNAAHAPVPACQHCHACTYQHCHACTHQAATWHTHLHPACTDSACMWPQVTEVYPYAQQGSMGRRDMRSGRCSCTAEEVEDGAVVRASWGEPYSGHVREHYQLVAGAGGVQELHVTSIITVGQRAESTLQVYTRSSLSSEQLVRANAARHGNYMDILKRHV
jgi:hypothetical protein